MKPTLLVATFALLGLINCGDGECETVEGKPYNVHQVQNIAPGTTADEVKQRVGEPIEAKRQNGGGEEWRYYWRCKGKSWVHVGPFQFQSGGVSVRSEAVIFVSEGRVERVLRNEPWVRE